MITIQWGSKGEIHQIRFEDKLKDDISVHVKNLVEDDNVSFVAVTKIKEHK